MSRAILYMAMSLDGLITGPDDGNETPAGVGGMRLWSGSAREGSRLRTDGPAMFEGLPPEHIELDLVRTLQAPGVLHIRYEVRQA